MDPEIQGCPAGFASSLTIPNVIATIKVLNGTTINEKLECSFGIGKYMPQKDYHICLTMAISLEGHEVTREVFIPLFRTRSITFGDDSDSNRLSISISNENNTLVDLDLNTEKKIDICKVFASFEKHSFGELLPAWNDELEALTSELRQSLQESRTPEQRTSFERVKVLVNKDGSDICKVLEKFNGVEKLCLDFDQSEPNFSFIAKLPSLKDLNEVEIRGRGFKTIETARFMAKLRQFNNIEAVILGSNHPDLKEKDLQTAAIIRYCPSHVKSLGLLFEEPIPHMIEYLRNLEHLYVSIHNLFSYRLFALPKLRTINVAILNSYKQNFFPATALGFNIDKKLVNSSYFAFDTVYYIEKTITKHIPSLFELASGAIYSNPSLEKRHLPEHIQSRLFHNRVDYQMCTACNKIFNDKLFSAWIIRQKKNTLEKQYFKHKFCHDCFEADHRHHLDYDVVVTRNTC